MTTCPTGAGTCQLTKGRAFHFALTCGKNNNNAYLSAQAAATLRQLFGPSVGLVVDDDISTFKAKHLVLLDQRLRELYGSDLPFGGKSTLLVRDTFISLQSLIWQ